MTGDRRLDEAEFARMIEGVATPPTRLTTADAVRFGRRSVRNRRYAQGGAAAGLCLALVAVAAWVGTVTTRHATPVTPPARSCTVTPLPMPSGGATDVNLTSAIDPTGHYVAGYSRPAVIWHDGVPAPIPLPRGGFGLLVTAVNSSGDVVGTMLTSPRAVPVVYRDGMISQLPVPPGYLAANALGINSAGDVVGHATAESDSSAVVVWRSTDPTHPMVLAVPANTPDGSLAAAIGDDGAVFGTLAAGEHPYRWNAQGVGARLAEAPGHTGGAVLAVSGTTAYGWVAVGGTVGSKSVQQRAARWNLRTGELTILPAYALVASGNAAGDMVVGVAGSNSYQVIVDGRPVTLPLPAGSDATASPGAAAADHTVVGSLVVGQTYAAAVWHC